MRIPETPATLCPPAPSRAISLLFLAAAALALSGRAGLADSPASRPLFEKDVQPILMANCVRCHGAERKRAGLDLRTWQGIFQGSESGRVVVPEKAEESPLYLMVHEGKMPPKKGRLSAADVETIRRWIQGGALSASQEKEDTGRLTGVAAVTQHDVLPVLLRHCTVCHGAQRREAGLDLRSKAAMLRGGKSGPALAPGKPEQSLLLRKIRDGQMPPPDRLLQASVQPMTTAETEQLARWIALGAPEASSKPAETLVTDKDRDFWAFRPPRPVNVPSVRHPGRVRNPIDAFILHQLEQQGWCLAPEADRLTLLRRASFDLTGLPPTPEEIRSFLGDRDPLAYEKAIDRLLASPRYGERWGRYWLDLAGYADSEGKRSVDPVRPFAYRYRDYVIRSFNADKPYDRFLLEQIAGDELADYEHAPAITPEIMDNLVATGFLRMAPDGTGSDVVNYVSDRLEVINDEIEVFSSAVLGLTIKCARCHSHKYDPIPQRDYYRLAAIFKGAYDENDWLRPGVVANQSQGNVMGHRLLPYATSDERRQREAHNRGVRERTEALQRALATREQALRQKYLDERLARLPEVLHSDLRRMLATPPARRDAVQKYLAEKFEKDLHFDQAALRKLDAGFRKAVEDTNRQVKILQGQLLPEPAIRALWDRGEPSPTFVYRRGDYLNPGELVEPGVPAVLTEGQTPFVVQPPWPGARQTGRRLALARWLVRPDHPLTARVLVNRLWKYHFGRGLVATLDNFGHTGARPSHPELLDWLAREFVRQGWSIKAMHRLLMTSRTYRQMSAADPELEQRDPENRLLGRMPLRRLEGEALYDTLLLAAGRLEERPYGPPDPVQVRPDGLVTPVETSKGWRRSIYVLQRRTEIPTLLVNFDLPQMNPNCIERDDSTVAPQALYLLNNAWVHELAGAFAHRVRAEAGTEPARQVERVYLVALGRPPTAEEKAAGLQALTKLSTAWGEHEKPGRDEAAQRALASLCHTVFNSAAFLYVD